MTLCTSCNKHAIGPEALSEGLDVCTVCRKCPTCNLVIAAHEITFCREHAINPFKHARCLLVTDGMSTGNGQQIAKSMEYESQLLNLARLLLLPDLDKSELANQLDSEYATDRIVMINQMSIEQIFMFMRKLQAAAARCSVFVNKNGPRIKEELASKAKKQFDLAALQALTSSRPAAKRDKPEDSQELEIGEFMRLNGIIDRKIAIKKLKLRKAAIDSYVSFGMTRDEAREIVDTPKVARTQ